jgi:hypothetical protein
MDEAPANSKESSHSAHANGMNEWINETLPSLLNFSSQESQWRQCCMLNTHKTTTENMIKHTHHPWHRIEGETDSKICLPVFPTFFVYYNKNQDLTVLSLVYSQWHLLFCL